MFRFVINVNRALNANILYRILSFKCRPPISSKKKIDLPALWVSFRPEFCKPCFFFMLHAFYACWIDKVSLYIKVRLSSCMYVIYVWKFADGLKVHAQKPESSTHFFVLTDISGSRSYTTCLTFYRHFSADKVIIDHIWL